MAGRLDLAAAAVLPDIVAATAAQAMLEQAGIPVMVRSFGSTDWLIPGGPGGAGPLEVMVPRERLAEARELIDALEAGLGEAEADREMAETEAGDRDDDPVS